MALIKAKTGEDGLMEAAFTLSIFFEPLQPASSSPAMTAAKTGV
jgi:hypothetical protein